MLHVNGWPQHVVYSSTCAVATCTGDKDSGFFRAKLVADYSVAPNRDDKLNVEVLARPAHAYNARSSVSALSSIPPHAPCAIQEGCR